MNDYRAAYRGDWHEVPAGGELSYTQRFFAGAKRFELLRDYQNDLSIPRFDDAIDWGNFWFPDAAFLHVALAPARADVRRLGRGVQFRGLAILASTIVIKLLAAVPTRLFVLQVDGEDARACAEDEGNCGALRGRQATSAAGNPEAIQPEKVNPVAGCVPILMQIPVFFALYKTLSVTIEMRHAPFVGWIHDLSARDPTSLFNLFGLLPYDIQASC